MNWLRKQHFLNWIELNSADKTKVDWNKEIILEGTFELNSQEKNLNLMCFKTIASNAPSVLQTDKREKNVNSDTLKKKFEMVKISTRVI